MNEFFFRGRTVVEVEKRDRLLIDRFDLTLHLSSFYSERDSLKLFTVTSSVTRTASLPFECWYLITQRATRALFLFFFSIVDIDVGVNFDAASSSSVEATRRLALAEKTSQSSKRTIRFCVRERGDEQ